MANEYLDKDGLKRLVSLVKDEIDSTSAELRDEIKQVDSRALTEEQVRKIVQETAVTQENDPTVPDWAKQDEKPKYTYEEITDKPTLVESISASIEGETLTVEIKDKDGNAIANTEVALPKQELPDFNEYVKAEDFDKEFKRSVTENTETFTAEEKVKACETIGAADERRVSIDKAVLENQALILKFRVSREDLTNNTITINLSHLFGNSSGYLIDWGTYSAGITKGTAEYTYNFSGYSSSEFIIEIKATGISSIDKAEFYNNQLLTYVKVPSSVKELGEACFRECKNLTEVDLPEGLTTIEQAAFHLCMSLKNLVIPSTVTGIGLNAFYRCEALEWVKFESHAPVDVWTTRFDRCNNLTKVFVPNDALEAYKTAWSATNFLLKLDADAYMSNIPPVPPTMNFSYKELPANTKYTIKRNGYYMIYSGSANLTLAKSDGTVVVEGAKQMQFMTPPIEGGSNIKACGMYWTGSSLGGVEGFRRSTNDGGYITASTDFFVAEMVKE